VQPAKICSADFVDQFRTEPEPKLIALQKTRQKRQKDKKESLTTDYFKSFSITWF